MWKFDSPYPISYSSYIVTKCVSPAVFEIFSSIVPDQCKSSLRMRDITWPVPPVQNLGTYFNFPLPHCLFTMTHLLGANEEGVFTPETPNVKREIGRKFSKSKNLSNFGLLGGLVVMGYKNYRLLVQKAHLYVNPRRLSHFAWRSAGGSDRQACSGKKVRKSQRLP